MCDAGLLLGGCVSLVAARRNRTGIWGSRAHSCVVGCTGFGDADGAAPTSTTLTYGTRRVPLRTCREYAAFDLRDSGLRLGCDRSLHGVERDRPPVHGEEPARTLRCLRRLARSARRTVARSRLWHNHRLLAAPEAGCRAVSRSVHEPIGAGRDAAVGRRAPCVWGVGPAGRAPDAAPLAHVDVEGVPFRPMTRSGFLAWLDGASPLVEARTVRRQCQLSGAAVADPAFMQALGSDDEPAGRHRCLAVSWLAHVRQPRLPGPT